jgi:hypothetical protein
VSIGRGQTDLVSGGVHDGTRQPHRRVPDRRVGGTKRTPLARCERLPPADARYRTPGREIGISPALGGLDVVSRRVQPPGPRHALEFVFTSVLEGDAGAGYEIDDRSRDKDLARFGG